MTFRTKTCVSWQKYWFFITNQLYLWTRGEVMIHLLSMSIADYLFHRKIITIDKYPVYQYGLEMIISTILGVVLVLLCGVLTGSILHAIIFYLLFVTLRMFTGGYHADTHFMCKLVLCGSFLTTNYICYLLSGEDTWGIYVSL